VRRIRKIFQAGETRIGRAQYQARGVEGNRVAGGLHVVMVPDDQCDDAHGQHAERDQ